MAARPQEILELPVRDIDDGRIHGRSHRRQRRAVLVRNVRAGAGQAAEFVIRQSERIEPDTEWFKDQVGRDPIVHFFC